MLVNCLTCNKEFRTYPSRIKIGWGKYCSNKCNQSNFKKGQGYWTGKKRPDLINTNAAKTMFGKEDKHFEWKGDKVKLSALHTWIKKHKGKAKSCCFCGENRPNKRYAWANKTGSYRREINGFFSLCHSCHTRYDNIRRKLNIGNPRIYE